MRSKTTFRCLVSQLLMLFPAAVTVQAVDFSIDKEIYSVGDVIEVTWNNSPGFAFDWFGVFKHPGPVNPNTYTDWRYTSGTQSPDVGTTSGSIAFPLSVPAGDYAMVFLRNNSYNQLADPIPFQVVDVIDPPPAEPVDLAATLSEPTQVGPAYLWTWSAPLTGYVEFNTFGSSTSTRLNVRDQSDLIVAENDDAFPPPYQDQHPTPDRSAVIFKATANETYKIGVLSEGGQPDGLMLNVLPVLDLPPAVALRETAIIAPDDATDGLVDQDIRGDVDFFRSDEEPPRYYIVHDVLMPNPGYEDRIKFFLVKAIKKQATTEYDIPHMLSWDLFPSLHEPATLHTQDPDGWARIGTTSFLSYDLQFMSVAWPSQLPNHGNRLVIIGRVSGLAHVRIFDASGNMIVDKADSELIKGNALTALKNETVNHPAFPDESPLANNLVRRRIIENATASAGPPLSFVTADEAASMQLEVFRNPFSPLADPTLAVEGFDGCTRDRWRPNSNALCHGGQHSRDVVITAVSAYYPHRFGYIDNERTIDEQSWQRGQGWGVTYGPSTDLDENEGKLRVRIDGADNVSIGWQLFQDDQPFLDGGLPVQGDTAISEVILPADARYELRFDKPDGHQILGVMNGSTYDIIKVNDDGTCSVLEDRELLEGQSGMTQFGGLLVKQGQIADVRVQYQRVVINRDLVTFVNPEDSGIVTGAGTFEEGSTVPIEATAADGYRFDIWTGDGISDPNNSSTTITIGPDPTATANFIKVWDLTLAVSNADAGTVTGDGTFDEGSEVNIEATANEGYRFGQWLGEGIADPLAASTTVEVTATSSVIAQFVKVWDIEVTAIPDNGGTVTGSGTFDEGSTAQIEASAAEGYRFGFWTGDGIADPALATTSIDVVMSTTVTANFVKVWELNVDATPSAGGTVTGSGIYDDGETVVISATAADGFQFVSWVGEGIENPQSSESTVTLERNQSVIAQFVPVWELILIAEPGDGGTVTGAGTFATGFVADIQAVAANGFRFIRWRGDGAAKPEMANTSVTISSETTLIAEFERAPVDFDQDDDGIDDAWEVRFNLDPNDPSDAVLDRDRDGQSALAEFIAQTDPGSAESVLSIIGTRLSDTEDAFILEWVSVLGIVYTIQSARAPDFEWIDVESVDGDGEQRAYEYSIRDDASVEILRLIVKASQGE